VRCPSTACTSWRCRGPERSRASHCCSKRSLWRRPSRCRSLREHGGEPGQIKEVCQDLSEAFLSGALEHLPDAEITFDRYHVKAQLTKAVDQVRRAERAEHGDLLKPSRYLWLRNPRNLTDRQRDRLDELLRHPLKTARAYRWMLKVDHVYQLPADEAEHYLRT
jgi:transposase